MSVDCSYKRVVTRDFDDVAGAVEAAIRAHGFTVSRAHDIQATLAAKGFQIQPLRIYEFDGRSETLGQAGHRGTSRRYGMDLLMPCRITVSADGSTIAVAALLPSVVSRMFPEAGVEELAAQVERMVMRVVDDAVA